jgi:hypothetical protein
MRLPSSSIALLLGTISLAARPALACGVSGPEGVSACSLSEQNEGVRSRFRLGVSGVYTSTSLTFGAGKRGNETRAATLGSFEYDPTRRTAFRAALGAAVGGDLDLPAGRFAFQPGVAALVGASWRAMEGKPFLSFSAVLSFTTAAAEPIGTGGSRTDYEAFDLRGGVDFGTTLFEVFSPYVLARAFGGPVFWRYQGVAVTGTDVSHYQLGAGLALLVSRRVDVFAEGVPLGERAFAEGVAFAF